MSKVTITFSDTNTAAISIEMNYGKGGLNEDSLAHCFAVYVLSQATEPEHTMDQTEALASSYYINASRATH